jgi:MraZ protein
VNVAGSVFQGESALTLDGKGRVTVPARHRELLSALCGSALTVTKHPARCLLVFPRPAWEQFRDRLLTLPLDAEDWRRIYLGGAMDVEIDGASRVLISPELRAWAGLERNVTLIGMGSRLELWDSERHAAREAAALAGPMPEALRNFVL